MTAPSLGQAEGVVMLAAGAVALVAVVYIVRKARPSAAKDSNGNTVTAYQNAGPVGVAGAAANAVSGGYLATFGDWLGTKFGDLTIRDPNAEANAALEAQRADAASAAADLQSRPFDYGNTNFFGW